MVVMIRGFIEMFRKMRAWLDARAYPPRDGVADRRVANWAFGLFLADIVFMIRGYAVSNLVETLLFATFLIYSPLRRRKNSSGVFVIRLYLS